MGKQMLFASPKLTQELSAGACLVGSLLCVMSKDGAQDVTCSETFIANKLGLTTRSVTRIKKLLVENGYLTFVSLEKRGQSWTARYHVTPKLVAAFEIPDTTDKISVDRQNVYPSQNVGTQTSCTQTTDKMSVDYRQNVGTTTDKMSEEKNIKEYRKENVKVIHTAQFFENVPLPTDDDAPCDEMDYSSSLETIPATTEQVKEKSSAKREKTKKYTYPTSTEEVLELFKQWRDKHIKLEPRIQGVNLELEAEKFFEYWEENNWSRKGKKMKSVNGSIATWLGNCCDKVRGNFKPKTGTSGMPAMSEETMQMLNAIGEKYNPDKPKAVEAEFEVVEEEKPFDVMQILYNQNQNVEIPDFMKKEF